MHELNNDYDNLCFGTGITWRCRQDSNLKKFVYLTRNFLKNRDQLNKDFNLARVIDIAMQNGCHMFDTSRAYSGSEYVLGKALKKYNRSSYVICTKLCNKDQFTGNVRGALEKSLRELGMDYVDIYLMHWPVKDYYIENWKQMEQLYREGLCRAIGVCNCNIHHLQALENSAEIMPMFNQIECHPLFTQSDLRAYCTKKNIRIMAYTSTGRMDERLQKTALVPIAKKYNKTIAQIILRWHQQIGNIPIVNTTNVKHMIENIAINDFTLSTEDIEAINAININSRLRYDPDNCDFSKL